MKNPSLRYFHQGKEYDLDVVVRVILVNPIVYDQGEPPWYNNQILSKCMLSLTSQYK